MVGRPATAAVPRYELREDYADVYLPDEDTFLLMDAVLNFEQRERANAVLEIGAGSGVVTAFLALTYRPERYYCNDVNPMAVKMANETLTLNGLRPVCTLGDMFEGITGVFDLIVFNPPYCIGDRASLGPIDTALSGGL